MIGRNESTTKGESVTGVVLTTARYQKRHNEIWCNLMWWQSMLEMLRGIETDRIWISITQITPPQPHVNSAQTDRQTDMARMCVCPSICQCVFVRFDELPWKALSKGLQIPEDSSPLERKKEQCWGAWRGLEKPEESVKPPAMFTLLRERASVLAGTAFSSLHTFHPALQIYDHTRTHTHHYSCCIVGLRRKKCVRRHNGFICALTVIEYKCVYVSPTIACADVLYVRCVHVSRKLKTETKTEGGTVPITERSHMHMHTKIKMVKGVHSVMDEQENTINFAGD